MDFDMIVLAKEGPTTAAILKATFEQFEALYTFCAPADAPNVWLGVLSGSQLPPDVPIACGEPSSSDFGLLLTQNCNQARLPSFLIITPISWCNIAPLADKSSIFTSHSSSHVCSVLRPGTWLGQELGEISRALCQFAAQ